MSRHWPVVIAMLAVTALTSGGCRSCSTCHDYDPPVANCSSGACGCQRAGSAFGGSVTQGAPSDVYSDEEYVVEPPADGTPTGTEESTPPQP
jgi:hypothetical protein